MAIGDDMPRESLLSHAIRVSQSLNNLNDPLPPTTVEGLNRLQQQQAHEEESTVQRLLDPHSIASVTIERNGSHSVTSSRPAIELQQHGWKCFLVKVINRGGFDGRRLSANGGLGISPNSANP